MPALKKRFLLVAVATGLAACGDPVDPNRGSPTILEPSFVRVPAECSTASLATLARAYFSSPEQQTVGETLRAMETSCATNAKAAAVEGGWFVLSTMESVLEAGTGGSAADGAALANALIQYMCGLAPALCAQTPALVSAGALGGQGIFAVRGDDAVPIIAHGVVPFTDFDGVANDALWGLETSTSWATATNSPKILIYGQPTAASGLSLDELSFGDLAYDLNTFPDVPGFNDGELHVGVCYNTEVTLPHLGGNPANPTLGERLQREGTLLQAFTPGCGAWRSTLTQTASLGGILEGMRSFAEWAFLPQPLHAAFLTDKKAPSTGGTPIDFSGFAPVAANTGGSLVFVNPPTDGDAGSPLAPVTVQALSGEGTPMELVLIELYVDGNQGSPAGATFCDPEATGPQECGDRAFTIETLDGYGTVATFNDATLYKAGGYVVCARALDSLGSVDFTFAVACSDMFHIKN